MDNTNIMSFGVYIHLPYCLTKCPYCDFNSYGTNGVFPEQKYLKSILNEIEMYDSVLEGNTIDTVFFGGGTPSLFSTESINKILRKLYEKYPVNKDIEVSLEVNPKTVTYNKLLELKNAGVNRISVGIQSFQQRKLDFYGRLNSPEEGENALFDVKSAGFTNFNIDLIYGSEGESISELKYDLEKAVEFEPSHISAYCLTIEEGTEFFNLYQKGELELPGDQQLIDFMTYTSEFLESKGYNNYEISNYSKPAYACKHNLIYWRSEDYIGFGAGAHSHIRDINGKSYSSRWANLRSPKYYMQSVENGMCPVSNKDFLLSESAFEDYLLMGLRLKEGVCLEKIEHKFNKKPKMKMLEHFIDDNFIEFESTRLRFTKKGIIYANSLILNVLSAFS